MAAVQEVLASCAFTGTQAALHCFLIQVVTPGTLHVNPDPGVVGFEAWFWTEGMLSGDQGGGLTSNVVTRRLDTATQAIDVRPWFTPPPDPGVDGIWLITGGSLGGTRCTTANIGRMLEPESFGLGGDFRIDAQNAFQTGSPGVDPLMHFPGGYDAIHQTVTYHLDTDTVVFDGTVTLNPYTWVFGDGEELSLDWGAPEGGEGEILPPGLSDYNLYTGKVRHTFEYHGVFFVYVEIGKLIDGELSYVLAERHAYLETWAATAVNTGNLPGGAAWNVSCPSDESYRTSVGCELVEQRDIETEEQAAVSWDAIPVQPVSRCASITRTRHWNWTSGGGWSSGFWSGGGSGSTECSYESEWTHVGYSSHENKYGWNDYHECRDAGTPPPPRVTTSATAHLTGVCTEAHHWWAPANRRNVPTIRADREPATLPLQHGPVYGAPDFGYPVRRVRPVLVPDP